jgi:ribosome-associated protein
MEITGTITIPEDELTWTFARSGGPGGQNVNKVNTKTELWVPIAAIIGMSEAAKSRLAKLAGFRLTLAGEIHIAAENHRTQEGNRSEAFDRLRDLIVQAMHVPKARRKTKPSKGAKRRRLDEKKRRGEVKSNRRMRGSPE